jgi:protein phosphatase
VTSAEVKTITTSSTVTYTQPTTETRLRLFETTITTTNVTVRSATSYVPYATTITTVNTTIVTYLLLLVPSTYTTIYITTLLRPTIVYSANAGIYTITTSTLATGQVTVKTNATAFVPVIFTTTFFRSGTTTSTQTIVNPKTITKIVTEEQTADLLATFSWLIPFLITLGIVLVAASLVLVTLRSSKKKTAQSPTQLGMATATGLSHVHNEDSLVTTEITAFVGGIYRRNVLMIVGDGMGGTVGGEIASANCVRYVSNEFYRSFVSSEPVDYATFLRSVLVAANRNLFEFVSSNTQYKGMGTTVTVAIRDGTTLWLANVGDSRAYVLRGRTLAQLTKDHTLVQEMVDRGEISYSEAKNHPRRNVITRAVGYLPDVQVDVFTDQLQDGDVVLLCSDGLSSSVNANEIAQILGVEQNMERAAIDLVKLAQQRGSVDDISVIVYRASIPWD